MTKKNEAIEVPADGTVVELPAVEYEHAPMAPEIALADIKWRIDSQPTKGDNPRARYISYITARTAAEYLDLWVGPDAWSVEYDEDVVAGKIVMWCHLTLHFENRTIVKTDLSDNTNAQGPKGLVSDAFKRAAASAGIGRLAYRLPEVWASVRISNGKAYPTDGVEVEIQAQLRRKGFAEVVGGIHDGPMQDSTPVDAPVETPVETPDEPVAPAEPEGEDVRRKIKNEIFVASNRDATKAKAAYDLALSTVGASETGSLDDETAAKILEAGLAIVADVPDPEVSKTDAWLDVGGDDPEWAVTKTVRREFLDFTEQDLDAAIALYDSLLEGTGTEPLSRSDAQAIHDALVAP